MVRDVLPTLLVDSGLDVMDIMVKKIRKIKFGVKSWIKRKEKDDMKELILYEMLIKEILVRNMTTNVSAEDRSTLKEFGVKEQREA